MSFIFSQVNGSHIGNAATPIDPETYYGTALESGIHNSVFASIYRFSEYDQTTTPDPELNPMVSKEDANHLAQSNGLSSLKFTEDKPLDEVSLLIDRHSKERDRGIILSEGNTGTFRGAGAMGVGFLGSMLNPLDLALNFVPIVGTAGKAESLAKAGFVARAMSRGLVTAETLESAGLGLKGYTAAVVNGAVGNAMSEIPLMIANRQDQTGYTAEEFGLAVGLGAVFGGGLHTVGLALKPFSERLGKAKTLHENLSPETHDNMAAAALEDFVQGREIDPGRLLYLDETLRETQLRLGEMIHISRSPDVPAASAPSKGYLVEVDFQDPELVKDMGLENKFMLTRNASVGQVGEGGVDPGKVPIKGAKMIGEPEGEWRVTSFSNDDPTYHHTFDTYEDAKKYIDYLAEINGEEGVVTTKELSAKQQVEQSIPQSDDIKSLLKTYDEQVALGNIAPNESVRDSLGTDANKESIDAYKTHEEQKKQHVEKQREQEIQQGRTIENPEQHVYHQDVDPKIETALDEEIANLEHELGLEEESFKQAFASQPTTLSDGIRNWNRWQAVLPEPRNTVDGRWPDKPEFTVNDVAWATKYRDSTAAELLDQLLKLDPELAKRPVIFDPFLRFDENARGMYDSGKDVILMDQFVGDAETFVHELTHAQTVKRIRREFEAVDELRGLGRSGKKYLATLKRYSALAEKSGVKNIVDTYLYVLDHFEKQGFTSLPDKLNTEWSFKESIDDVPHYGLTNLDEFITEGLTNPAFREVLKGIKLPKETTLLNKFVTALKEIFGLKPDDESALSRLIEGYSDMVKQDKVRFSAEDLSTTVLQQASNCALL